MNDANKLKQLPGVESLPEEVFNSICIFKKTKAVLDQTYSALGRKREYGITNTTASYPLKIIPNEQSTTKNIQIGTRLA